jgi:hypothetical protein
MWGQPSAVPRITNTKKKRSHDARRSVVCPVLFYPRESVRIRGVRSWPYFNSSTSFSFPLLISSIFLISPSVSF